MKYILLLDKEPEILEILKESLESMIDIPLRTTHTVASGIKTIEEEGRPELVIVLDRIPKGNARDLYEYLLSNTPEVPFILLTEKVSSETLAEYTNARAVIPEGSFVKGLRAQMNDLFPVSDHISEYLKVPVEFFLGLSSLQVDTYLKLSENSFVKVYAKGHLFDEYDLQKLQGKFFDHLYMRRKDFFILSDSFDQFMEKKFISNKPGALKNAMGIIRKNFENHLDQKITNSTHQNSLDNVMDILDTTFAFSKALGWDEANVRLARKTVDQTIKILAADLKLADILGRQQQNNFYAKHVSLLSLLVCVVAQGIGWTSESTQQKLVMASLMHDYFVDEAFYEGFSNKSVQSEYQLHPIKIAELARSIKGLPSDVDQILLQHHEKPDGTGFPRGLTSSHISPLSAIFIICEELIHFTRGQEITPDLINKFWEKNAIFTKKEPFKKIFLSMISKG